MIFCGLCSQQYQVGLGYTLPPVSGVKRYGTATMFQLSELTVYSIYIGKCF